MTPDYEAIVRRLRTHGDLGKMEVPATEVGRNRVWRVGGGAPDLDVFYVKLLDDRTWFDRELLGMEVAGELAEHHDWVMAPDIRYVDRERYAHVTGTLPGDTVSALLRRSHRIDRNPLRRREPREEFSTALKAVVQWLHALHGRSCPGDAALYDHSMGGVRERVVQKLRRGLRKDALSIDPSAPSRLSDLPLPDPTDAGRLICGDATLGNFVWDGRRIGRIDFEDLGCGIPARDHFSLRQQLTVVDSLIWYWSLEAELCGVPRTAGDLQEALYRLEWLADLHWRSHRAGSRWRAGRAESEIEDQLAHLGAM